MTNSPTRWPAAEFERLRHSGDPEIDDAVAEYLRAHRGSDDARALMPAVIHELADAKRRARGNPPADAVGAPASGAPAILDELGLKSSRPDWGNDTALIERGQKVFQDHGLYQAVALCCVCLPLAYAEPGSAKVLAEVSDLGTGNLTRRVAETGQMLVDLMGMRGPDTLEPGGPAHTTAIGLRVLHSFVRAIVGERHAATGPGGARDTPVDQELLLATLIDFSSVTCASMERMGVTITDADRTACLYLWSVFGHLMGVEACRDAPLTLADVEPIEAHLEALLDASEEGRRLMAALLADMESFMFLGWRKLPRTMIHWLFRDWGPERERVPGLLGVPGPAWWALPLLSAARAAHRRRWTRGPLWSVIQWLLRKAGRYMIIGFVDHYSGGRAPFQIPPELARTWRVRQSRPARRVRTLRRRTRQTVRRGTRRTAHAPLRRGRAAREA